MDAPRDRKHEEWGSEEKRPSEPRKPSLSSETTSIFSILWSCWSLQLAESLLFIMPEPPERPRSISRRHAAKAPKRLSEKTDSRNIILNHLRLRRGCPSEYGIPGVRNPQRGGGRRRGAPPIKNGFVLSLGSLVLAAGLALAENPP